MPISTEAQKRLDRIAEYEKKGYFDRDINDDPPTRPLKPGEVDYTCKKLSTKIASKIANKIGQNHFEKMMKKGDVVLKEIRGQENLASVKDRGTLVTCNHFSVFDNYAVYKALKKTLGKLWGITHEYSFPLTLRDNIKKQRKIIIFFKRGMHGICPFDKVKLLRRGIYRLAKLLC